MLLLIKAAFLDTDCYDFWLQRTFWEDITHPTSVTIRHGDKQKRASKYLLQVQSLTITSQSQHSLSSKPRQLIYSAGSREKNLNICSKLFVSRTRIQGSRGLIIPRYYPALWFSDNPWTPKEYMNIALTHFFLGAVSLLVIGRFIFNSFCHTSMPFLFTHCI